jgi:hypothetical protein
MHARRHFRREEEAAKQQGGYPPAGLINTEQFRHAWRRIGVRLSEEEARALFQRHGCDGEGLLPYDVFVAKLLSSPGRLLSMEPEQKVSFGAGSMYADTQGPGASTGHCKPCEWTDFLIGCARSSYAVQLVAVTTPTDVCGSSAVA